MTGSDEANGDRRRGDRIPINDEFSRDASTWVSDLSTGGVFVHGAELLPVGSTIELRFTVLLDDPVVIAAVGKVARHSRRPPGIGVQFTSIDELTRARIEDVLARHQPLDSGAPLRLPEPAESALSSGSGVNWARPAPVGELSLTSHAPQVIDEEDDVTRSFERTPADVPADAPTMVFRPPPSLSKSGNTVDEDERTRQFPSVRPKS